MRVVLSEALAHSGASSLIGTRYQGRGTILMLHSIVDDTRPYMGQTLRCSLKTLERSLRWVRDQGLDIVTLDEASRRLSTLKDRGFVDPRDRRFVDPKDRRFVVFTFDDGYRDNLTRVLPLMELFAAPFTVYVPSRILSRDMDGWWLGLVPLVRDNETVEVAAMERNFETRTVRDKYAAMTAIGRWVFEDGRRTAALSPTFARYGISTSALLDEEAMTATQLRQLAASPLVTIGAHTLTHPFLSQLPEGEAAHEITACKSELQSLLGRNVDHFSYPYGAAGDREAVLAQAAGYSSAVTTANGTLFPVHAGDGRRFALPRETLDEHDTRGCLHCRTRGVYRFLKSRAGPPAADYRKSA